MARGDGSVDLHDLKDYAHIIFELSQRGYYVIATAEKGSKRPRGRNWNFLWREDPDNPGRTYWERWHDEGACEADCDAAANAAIKAVAEGAPGFGILCGTPTAWWDGRYPQLIKLVPRITAWRVEDIRRLKEHGSIRQ